MAIGDHHTEVVDLVDLATTLDNIARGSGGSQQGVVEHIVPAPSGAGAELLVVWVEKSLSAVG